MDPRTLDELVRFVKQHHPGFSQVSDAFTYHMFGTYAQTTAIERDPDGRLIGVALWQDWGNELNIANVLFVVSTGASPAQIRQQIKRAAPGRRIVYFDETLMKARTLCRQSQQSPVPSVQQSAALPQS